jgi:FSR family fosmidomycin resistance protein-like MFS transporter
MASVISFPRREAKAIGLIGFAHMLSHIYPLTMPLLLSPITQAFQMSALEWGAVLAVFAIVTGVLQTPMGFLIERVGGRKVLIFGLLVFSASFFCVGWLATNFWEMMVLMAIAGIGNSVFHPADYSLISSSIDEERLGRAYSIHTFVGQFGFLAGPVLVAALEPSLGWRATMMTIGGVGILMTGVLVFFGQAINEGNEVKKKASIRNSLRDLLTSRPILMFFLFYMGSSLANYGVTQFSVIAFESMYGFSSATAVIALTAYQLATLALVLPGGLLADKTDRYGAIIIIGFGVAAVAVFLAGTNLLPYWLVVGCLVIGGAMRGGANASRDVAVRHVATNVPVGTVFGFVSSGFLVGQGVGGPLYGWLFDNYPPQMIFYASAAFSVLALVTVLFNRGAR